MVNPKIIPSVMAKNQKELDFLLNKLQGVSKEVHFDVTDGKFVPTKYLNFDFKLKKEHFYQAHLLMKDPLTFIKKNFKKIKLFIVPFETVKNTGEYIQLMKKLNEKIAFSINPETPVRKIKPFLKKVDYILVLTVHPGFYGGKFLPAPLKKIREIKRLNPQIKVIVDGGMNPHTIKSARKAGGDIFISGSYVTKAEKPKERMKEMMRAIS